MKSETELAELKGLIYSEAYMRVCQSDGLDHAAPWFDRMAELGDSAYSGVYYLLEGDTGFGPYMCWGVVEDMYKRADERMRERVKAGKDPYGPDDLTLEWIDRLSRLGMKSRSTAVRGSFQTVVAEQRPLLAVDYLPDWLMDSDEGNRWYAVACVEKLHDYGRLDVDACLETALGDEDGEVVLRALVAGARLKVRGPLSYAVSNLLDDRREASIDGPPYGEGEFSVTVRECAAWYVQEATGQDFGFKTVAESRDNMDAIVARIRDWAASQALESGGY